MSDDDSRGISVCACVEGEGEGEGGGGEVTHSQCTYKAHILQPKPSEMTTCSLGLSFCRMMHFAGNFRVNYLCNVMHRLG